MFTNYKLWIVSLLFSLSIFCTFTWIPQGKFWGGADVGIPMFYPENQLSTVASAWWEKHSTGTTNSMTYTSVPFYNILIALEKVGSTPEINEKLFVFIILFGGSWSVFAIAVHFGFSKKIGFLAALFSIFNFYTLSVWHRGVHNGMLMLLFIPLSFLIIYRGISKKSYLSLLTLHLVSFFASYIYGAPGFVVALWILWLTTLIFQFVIGSGPEKRFIVSFTLLLIFSWLFLNAWWLFHFIESSKYVFESLSLSDLQNRTIDVVIGLKRQTEVSYVLRGISRYNLYDQKDWGEIYSHPVFVFLSWIPTIILFSTSLFKKNVKSPIWTFNMLLILIVVFISKGINPPLGWLAKILYEKFSLLAPLRNPYEKIGILLILPFSFLFGLGITQIFYWFKQNIKWLAKPFLVTGIFLSVFVLVWPMWLGKTFVVPNYNYLISVPDYYSDASLWLKANNNDMRILHLPLAPEESVDYDWGYTGGVPSQVFFSGSSIAYKVGIQSVDFQVNDLIYSIHEKDTETIIKLLESLNVGWIIIHNETESERRGHESLAEVNKWLGTNPNYLQHQIDFGPLSLWKVTRSESTHFYSPTAPFSIIRGKPEYLNSYWKNQITEKPSFIIANPEDSSTESKIIRSIEMEYIYPAKVVRYSDQISESSGTLPYVSKLPGSLFYPLIRFKEFIEGLNTNEPPTIRCLNMASKRLSEAISLKKMGLFETNSSLVEYNKLLQKCGMLATETTLSGWSVDRLLIYDNFIALNNVFSDESEAALLENSRSLLKQIMYDLGINPYFDRLSLGDDSKAIAYSYNLSEDGVYSLEIDEFDPEVFNTPILVKINDQAYNTEPVIEDNKLIFSNLSLKAGKNEVHIKYFNKNIFSIEKAKFINDVTIISGGEGNSYTIEASSVQDKLGRFEFDLSKVKDIYSYDIVTDYFVQTGAAPVLKVNQDSDYVDPETRIVFRNLWFLELNTYNRFWIRKGYTYEPSVNANNATVIYEIPLWNDCLGSFSQKSCRNKEFLKIFDRSSKVLMKDIGIIPNYEGLPTLQRIINGSNEEIGDVEFQYNRINGENYKIDITNQKPPYVLIFSETFHPLWKLNSGDGKEIEALHFQANGYANAWFIESELPDRIYVKFSLSDYRRLGNIISIISLIILLPVIIYLNRKKVK